MRRTHRALGLLIAVFAVGLAVPSASVASCGVLGLFSSCPPPPQPSEGTNPDGSLRVSANPYALEPLPAREAGEPLFPRDYGHLYFGLADHAADEGSMTYDQVGGVMEAIGATFGRLSLLWPSAEFQHGYFTWSRYDTEYRAFIAHGVRPFWTVMSTPRWAAPAGASCTGYKGNYCDAEPSTTDGLAGLKEFGQNLARRYPLAAGFEYRNEPNLDAQGECTDERSWHVPPDVYTRSLLAFAAGVHAGNPTMRVLGGGLSGCRWWDRPTRYLDAMLTHGAAKGMDGLSWHPGDVSSDFSRFKPGIDEIAAVLREHDAADIRMVASEVGYASKDTTQSERLRSEYMLINTQDSSLDLVQNFDGFIGFTDVATEDKDMRPYGWVGRKDMFKQYPAKQVFCDFRALLGLGRPLPSYMRDCMFAGS